MSILDRRSPLVMALLAMAVVVAVMSLSACGGSSAAAQDEEASSLDWDAVGEAIGKEGERMEGDVYRINMPRSDLSVTSQGVDIKPGLALGSYAAFKQTGENEALVMGDLVLTEDEYNPVIDRLQEGGIEQTAIHKHLLNESPAVWWTHIHGRGDPDDPRGTRSEWYPAVGIRRWVRGPRHRHRATRRDYRPHGQNGGWHPQVQHRSLRGGYHRSPNAPEPSSGSSHSRQ